MNILIAGLGLIGGSLAKSIKKNTSYTVLGYDIDGGVLQSAKEQNAIDKAVNEDEFNLADVVFVALYPKAAAQFINNNVLNFKKGCIVCDCCGIKKELYNMLDEQVLNSDRFTFIGGHPMEGREVYGFENSIDNLYDNAPFIMTPQNADKQKVQQLEQLILSIGFKSITKTDISTHDYMIAYTSQLAHVLACSYIFDPLAQKHNGFSAGSFLDVTRVARINENMWAELFLENKQALSDEIDVLIKNLNMFKNAIDNSDEQTLRSLMKKSCQIKENL